MMVRLPIGMLGVPVVGSPTVSPGQCTQILPASFAGATGKLAKMFDTAEFAAIDLSVAKPLAVGARRGVGVPAPWRVVYSYAPRRNNLFLIMVPPTLPPTRLLSWSAWPGIVPPA